VDRARREFEENWRKRREAEEAEREETRKGQGEVPGWWDGFNG